MLRLAAAAFGGSLIGATTTSYLFVRPHPLYLVFWVAGALLIVGACVAHVLERYR